MLNIESIEGLFYDVVNSDEWKELQEKFNNADDIYVLGHGGNLAVASHAAIDISRLSNGTKNAMCPDSATVVTSLINDTDFDHWMHAWLKMVTSSKTQQQLEKSLILGFSSSGTSRDLIKAFQWGYSNDIPIACVTAKPLIDKIPTISEVQVGCDYYHTIEVLSLLLQYELTHGSGKVCPPIGDNRPEDISRLNTIGEPRVVGFKDELRNMAVDFDGVIHKNSKGFHDGTIYDEPLENARESLKRLSENYDVVLFTAKAKPDRGLVNGKTGTQLVWEWLEKHDMDKFVTKVTAEKPRAVQYIDDKGYHFTTWEKYWEENESMDEDE